MFRRLPDDRRPIVSLTIDGAAIEAHKGDSVSAAMLAAGSLRARTAVVSGAPRAPYCMMGVCFDCLLTIDGIANQQGCMVTVRPGMQVRTQAGPRRLDRVRPA